MKGLYVYGALLMALCFASGAVTGDRSAMAAAVIAAMVAALSEAAAELYLATGHSFVARCSQHLALASWVVTGAAGVLALTALVSGG